MFSCSCESDKCLVMPGETDCTLELDLGEPSQELLQWAEKEIGEHPGTKLQCIQDLRDMIFGKGMGGLG